MHGEKSGMNDELLQERKCAILYIRKDMRKKDAWRKKRVSITIKEEENSNNIGGCGE